MKGERCKFSNKICQNEISDCSKCETYKIYTENLTYMEKYRKVSL